VGPGRDGQVHARQRNCTDLKDLMDLMDRTDCTDRMDRTDLTEAEAEAQEIINDASYY